MIDPLVEELLSLAEAPKFLPGRRQSKRPHVSCVYRWTTVGCRGVILESIQVGGTRCTSREALARFMASLTRLESPSPTTTGHARPVPLAADRELDRLLGNRLHDTSISHLTLEHEMTTKPSPKRSGKTPKSLPPRPTFELDALLPHQRSPSTQLLATISKLTPEIADKFETLHELIEKQTQAEMVCAYQVGMIVQYLGKGIGSETDRSNVREQFATLAADLGVEAQYFDETLKLVEVFDLPRFGALIRKSSMTWQQVRQLLEIEAPAAQLGLVKRIGHERHTVG